VQLDRNDEIAYCGEEKWINGFRWGQKWLGHDNIGVYMAIHDGRPFIFEGNKIGYGRRTWLNFDGTITHEHGIFEVYNGK